MSEFIWSFFLVSRVTQKEGICKSAEITIKWVAVLFSSGLCENEAVLLYEALPSEHKDDLDIYVDAFLLTEDWWDLFFSGIDGKRKA